MLTKSQAETGKDYVVLQGRFYSPVQLHIQGVGHTANRKYGISANVFVEKEVAQYLGKQPRPLLSKAQTGQKYFKIQARPRKQTLHFQFVDGAANRSYGMSFDVTREAAGALWTWCVENLID
jgi:hypothetical protein